MFVIHYSMAFKCFWLMDMNEALSVILCMQCAILKLWQHQLYSTHSIIFILWYFWRFFFFFLLFIWPLIFLAFPFSLNFIFPSFVLCIVRWNNMHFNICCVYFSVSAEVNCGVGIIVWYHKQLYLWLCTSFDCVAHKNCFGIKCWNCNREYALCSYII